MYQSICNKYGGGLLPIGLAISGILARYTELGYTGGGLFAGIVLATISELAVRPILSFYRVGFMRGSKIYRGIQASFVVTGILIGGSVDYIRYEGSRPHDPQQHTRVLNTHSKQLQLNS